MRRRRVIALGLLALAEVTCLDAVLNLHWWGAPFLALAFILLVPGLAIVGNLGLESPITELTAGMALSLALGVCTAEVMLWAHMWDPVAAVLLLSAGSAPLLLRQASLRTYRMPHRAPRVARLDDAEQRRKIG